MTRNGVAAELEVDETGAGDGCRFAPFGDLKRVDDAGGELTRVLSALLRQNQSSIRLIIAEARIGRGRDLPRLCQVECLQGGRKLATQNGGKSFHNDRRTLSPSMDQSLAGSRRRSFPRDGRRRTNSRLLRFLPKDAEDLVARIRASEVLANRSIVQKLGDGSKSTEVRLELIFRDNEENDKFHGSVIECIKFDPCSGATESCHDFV